MNFLLRIVVIGLLGFASLVGLAAKEKPAPQDPVSDHAGTAVEPGKVFVYKNSGSGSQELEVYFPPEWSASQRLPVVILFHGGSWTGGTLDQFRYACRYLASRGLVAVTANYQLAAKGDEPSRKRGCITDAKSAIRWVKQHASELGVDPDRVVTGGGSAGGHVALLATLNPGLNDPADSGAFDTQVIAYLLFNPAFDPKDATDPEVDVLNFLRADLPPMIFFSGTIDRWKQGTDTVRSRLHDLGPTHDELWLAEGQRHGFFNRAPWQDVTLREADRFLVQLGLLQGAATLPAPASGESLKRAR